MMSEIDLLPLSGRPWLECKAIIQKDISKPPKENKIPEYKTIRLLPRKDLCLFGECPKLDTKVLIECEKCGNVILPCIYAAHCKNPNHDKLLITVASSKPSSSKNSKPSNYIPSGSSLVKKKYQQPKNKKKSGLPPPVPPPPLFTKNPSPPQAAPVVSSVESSAITQAAAKPSSPQQSPLIVPTSHSSSKHKKNKKSGKRSKEDAAEKVEKTEKHAENNAVTKVTTSVSPRKESTKSKDYQVFIDNVTETTATTTTTATVKTCKDSTTSSNRSVPTYVKVTPTSSQSSIQKVDIVQPIQVAVAPTSINKTQGNLDSSPPSSVVYMPMSPVSVNNVLVQFLQLPVLRVASTKPLQSPPLATQPIVVTIPLQCNNTPAYNSHPKPLSMTTRSLRKLGQTFLLQSQRLDHQRNEIRTMINTRRVVTNSNSLNTFHHRPNILKNSARSNVKIAVKRTANDKLVNDNNKHIRLNDVNGFILHADVSESAEAPLHNNSVHDKVTFLNMK